jgi:hypothetical protein
MVRVGVGLRRAYWVAQVSDADAWDDGRVAEDDWGASEVVEESNSGAEKDRGDVDVDFVEESRVETLLDGVGAVDSNGLPGSCGFGLVDGGFDTVGDEVYGRVGTWPPVGDVVGEHECRSPGVVSAPSLGFVEGASAGEHGAKFGYETVKVLGARTGHAKRHGVRSSNGDFNVAGEIPVEHFGHAIVEVGDVAVERH